MLPNISDEILDTNELIILYKKDSVEIAGEETNEASEQIEDIKFEELIEDITEGLYGFQQTEVKINHSMLQFEYCPKSFSWVAELDEHVEKYQHPNNATNLELIKEAPWNLVGITEKTCNICFKEFTTIHSLKTHIDSVHENIKLLCDHCDHIFSSKRNLRGHIGKGTLKKIYPHPILKLKRIIQK